MAFGLGSDAGGGLTDPGRQGGLGASVGSPIPMPRQKQAAHPLAGMPEYTQGMQDRDINTDGTRAANGPNAGQQMFANSTMPGQAPTNGQFNDGIKSPGGSGADLGYSNDEVNNQLGVVTDQISGAEQSAKTSANERAAALGFAHAGGTEEAMQRMDSDAAGAKAGALRDIQNKSADLGFERQKAEDDRNFQREMFDKQLQAQKDAANDAKMSAQEQAQQAAANGAAQAGNYDYGKRAADQFPVKFQVAGGGSGRISGGASPAGSPAATTPGRLPDYNGLGYDK